MWTVTESTGAVRALMKAPAEIAKKYEAWKTIVRMSGPMGLRAIRGFNDEALGGEWAGFRSSRLNLQYRVIYQVVRDEVRVQVERVTPHDYRR